MRKLGTESETSSVTEGFGDFRAVTVLEDGVVIERPSRSWRPGKLGSKTSGWWKM